MAEEHEIEEHIHHAQQPFDKLVAGVMAIIAATLAVVSVLGQHYNTINLLRQQKASDEWAFYQAKNIRRYVAGVGIDLLKQSKADAKAIEKYSKDETRYDKDMEGIKEKAEGFEKQSEAAGEQAEGFHRGEVFLEIGIVLSSLSILTKRRAFFYGGAVAAAVGVVIASRTFMF